MTMMTEEEEIQMCLNCTLPLCINCLGEGEDGPGKRPVLQYDPRTGEAVAAYPTVKAAADAVGVSDTLIRRCLDGKAPKAGGYIWKDVKR